VELDANYRCDVGMVLPPLFGALPMTKVPCCRENTSANASASDESKERYILSMNTTSSGEDSISRRYVVE